MTKALLLSFEKSVPGRCSQVLPPLDVPPVALPEGLRRKEAPLLPELNELDVSRHYAQLAQRTYGVNHGFYPLGSCTMKYNPAVQEAAAALPGFTATHPLAPAHASRGCRAMMRELEADLCQITGMDAFTLQPAAGAHGELCGMLCIKAYHQARGEGEKRRKVLVPDSAHGTNPATATMAGYTVVSVPSRPDGCVDIQALKGLLGPDIAGIMLTNPNTLGLFEKDILTIAELVHGVGGLLYYDGANLNAILGVARPGDMGFDVTHLNVHKTLGTPHGGGGPGAGPVGVKAALAPYLPGAASAGWIAREEAEGCGKQAAPGSPCSTPDEDGAKALPALQLKGFYGNFSVLVKTLCYLKTLGRDGLRPVGQYAVLNANYLMKRLKDAGYTPAKDVPCMHEFVLTLEPLREAYGVSALDVAKAMIDHGMHPPTMYFPLIVQEALMFEPTETESQETLDQAAEVLAAIMENVKQNPEALHHAPHHAVIGRPDEVAAARSPILRHQQNR